MAVRHQPRDETQTVGTADSILGAELRIIEGLGHDMPEALIDEFAAAILAAAERSSGDGR